MLILFLECFDWSDGKPTLSNQTKYFINYFNTAKKCINDHMREISINNNTDEICKDCMSDYVMLNSFYESLKGTSETVGICMDIVDSVSQKFNLYNLCILWILIYFLFSDERYSLNLE